MRPGISCSARRISLRPSSARDRSATLKLNDGWLMFPAVCASPPTGQGRTSAYRRVSLTPGRFAKNRSVDPTIEAYTHAMVRLGLWLLGRSGHRGGYLG